MGVSTDGLLYRLGDTTLTVEQVVAQIPPGLTPADSAALFEGIAQDWLYSMLLERDITLSYTDRKQIEAQVRQYRRRLLASRYYESVIAEGDEDALSEDSVRAIYEQHKESYVLTAPLVKGLLLQLPANTPQLERIRALMKHPTLAEVDRLEKLVLNQALQYEYFLDDWQDWQDIALLVPYRFPEADAYVAKHPALETRAGGTIYFLTVTEHLATGQIMPYEKAAQHIRASLLRQQRGQVSKALLRKLMRQAEANGTLKIYAPNRN